MDNERIVKNMKAVLKAATGKGKGRNKKRQQQNNDCNDDETIAELMDKNWKMKSPKGEKSPQKPKINAFEKLMNNSKKSELTSPEITSTITSDVQVKKKRKYTKRKSKNQETESEKIDPESDLSILDEETLIQKSKGRSGIIITEDVKSSSHLNGIQKFFGLKETQSPSNIKVNGTDNEDKETVRKRNRGSKLGEENTPKRRRKSAMQLDSNENEAIEESAGVRPRRSCVSNINYTLFQSPEKESPEKKTRRKSRKEKDEEFDVSLIEIDEISPVNEKNVKLAPVFVKKVPKPVLDPAIKEARRNFLFSTELPSNIRATIDKQKQLDEEILSNDLIAFPPISHVTQASKTYSNVDFKHSNIPFNNDDYDSEEIFSIDKKLTCGKFTYCNLPVIVRNKKEENFHELNSDEVKTAVRKVKDTSGTFPVNRLFKQLLRKHKNATSDDVEIAYHNSLFIDIFRPSKFDEYLIATRAVEELKQFLTTWNDRNSKFDDYDSDSNSRSSLKGSYSNNCVVLSGHNGCGKTSSVYALANDLNYEVIEINAGSRRSGKKMLQDLYEATQSHRVEKRGEDSDHLCSQNDTTVDKRTIILIEDAEIAFDSDDGFISSIQQLINITKRPVILTTNNRSCPHLQRFIQCNEIIYESPCKILTIKYLTLLCLAAASSYQYRQINEIEIEQLYSYNEYDLRKTINEIEFYIRTDIGACKLKHEEKKRGLMEFYECKQQKKRQSLVNVTREKDLVESSIVSSCCAIKSMFQQRVASFGEISHHSSSLMNEIISFIDGSHSRGNEEIKMKSSICDDLNVIGNSCGNVLSSRAKIVDYSPLLRSICRSEKARETNSSRRTSRSHHLRFMLPNNSFKSEYFNEQCEVFQQDE